MANDSLARAVIGALRLLPVGALSRLVGWIVSVRLPPVLQRLEIRAFGRVFDVDFDEARDPVESFETFQQFFTRRLRADARPVASEADAFVSPCDGAWGCAGVVSEGTLLQVKGRAYSLRALLGTDDVARFEGGHYATLYLSPRDYHRFHAPCDVRVAAARYIPGRLWPVNSLGLQGVDGLFAQNERICADMGLSGGGAICIVAVGATLVGSVKVEFDDLSTNQRGAHSIHREYGDEAHRYPKGAEWGRFEFGSTLVLVCEPGVVALDAEVPGAPVRLGTRIGSVL